MTALAQHFIAGSWIGEPSERKRHNPARPDDVVASLPIASAAEAEAAVDAATEVDFYTRVKTVYVGAAA